jgi:hypothetical protein
MPLHNESPEARRLAAEVAALELGFTNLTWQHT